MVIEIQKGSALSSLSLMPLIDVVFLLLIFFLVATRFAEDEREMTVRLPEAGQAQPLVSKPREVVVNIDAGGGYFIAGEQQSLDQLVSILQTARINNPIHASAIIRADEGCRWEAVIAVMNACREAKIEDYRVTTRTPGG